MKATQKRRAFFASMLALSAAGEAWAQTQTANLGELVVTARARDGAMLGGAEITGEDLRRYDRASVDEALDLTPGANAGNTGGSRNERLIFVRGFDRLQTTLSIDGVRVFLPADNRIDFGRFLTADLEQVQISKGYVSVLDGPGGLGGAINLVTRTPREAFEAELTTAAGFDGDGTYNGYNASARLGGRGERFYWQASGAYNERDHWALSDDFTPVQPTLEDGGERNRSDTEDERLSLKFGYTPNETDEYALNYISQSGSRNAPLHISDNVSTPRHWKWPYWDIESIYFLSNTRLADGVTLRSRIYRNTFQNLLAAYNDSTQTTQSLPRAFMSYYDDVATGLNLQLSAELGQPQTILNLALHARRDRHDERQDGFVNPGALAYSEPWQRNEEDTYSLALELNHSVGETIDLIFGLSHDWTDLRQADDINATVQSGSVVLLPVSFARNDMDALNAQAAIAWRVAEGQRLHASISSRARFPTLMERFSSRMGTAVPNPGIGPERALNYEIGWQGQLSERVRGEAAIFYSDLTDALFAIPVTFPAPIGLQNQTQNVAEGQYYGAEFALTADLTDSLRIGGNYTYIERDFTDPTNPNFRAQGVPNHKAFVYLDWSINDALTLTPNVEFASDRYTVTTTTPLRYYEIGEYALLNLALNWQITPSADLLFGARNLTDENYSLTDGFPEQGRNYYLSLRYRM